MAGGATYGVDDDDGGMISGINVTPLVDITLVLLIVFMVTAKLIAARAIPVDTPKTASGKDVTGQIELSIDAGGATYYNGEPASIDEITARIRAAARGSDEVRPIITADATVDHGDVMAVVDSVKLAGVHKFAVTTRRATK